MRKDLLDSKKKFSFYIIHNYEADRLSTIYLFKKFLESNNYKINLVSEQNKKSFSNWAYKYKDIYQFKTTFLWSDYINCTHRYSTKRLMNTLYFLKNLIKPGNKKVSLIESIVTQKHLTALTRFLDSDENDYIVVMESDFLISDYRSFTEDIENFIDSLKKQYIFVNLGGGYNLRKIGCECLLDRSSNKITEQTKPFTNTAVSYIMDKNLVFELVNFINLKRSGPLNLAIDWTLNDFFLHASNTALKISGYYAHPPFVKHGSFQENYVSWKNRLGRDFF